MKQKIPKSVKNPLAMIALFAGISEIAMSYTLVNIPIELQRIFIWFVMSFPFVLVGAFFFVLYTKPAVLFAPSDYDKDEMYLNSISNQPTIQENLKVEQIEESVKVLQDFMEQVIATGNHNSEIETNFVETRRKLDSLHTMQHNNLFSFLKKEIELGTENIFQLIQGAKDIRELPLAVMEMTNDQWKSDRMEKVLIQFPAVFNDFDQLTKIINGESK